MKPVKRYVLTEGSSLTDDLTGVDPGRCKWVEEGDVVGLVDVLKAILDYAGASSLAEEIDFDTGGKIAEARNELARRQS